MFIPWKAGVAVGLVLGAAGQVASAASAPVTLVSVLSLSAPAAPGPLMRPLAPSSCRRRANYVRYRGHRVRAHYLGSRIVRYHGRRYRVRYFRRY